MKKIKLDLDDLAVETFQSAAPSQALGTVAARELYDTSSCDTECERSHCISGPCCGAGL